jgi:hypothetical protein
MSNRAADLERVKQHVLDKIGPDWTSHGSIRRRIFHLDRPYFTDAVDQLIAEGRIEHQARMYHGQPGNFYRTTTAGRARSTAGYWKTRPPEHAANLLITLDDQAALLTETADMHRGHPDLARILRETAADYRVGFIEGAALAADKMEGAAA